MSSNEKNITLNHSIHDIVAEVTKRFSDVMPPQRYTAEEAVRVMTREVAIMSMLSGAFYEAVVNQPGASEECHQSNKAAMRSTIDYWFERGRQELRREPAPVSGDTDFN